MMNRKNLKKEILEKIPYDSWVASWDIARPLGIRNQLVGQIIHYYLKNIYVERKERTSRRNYYLYRRISRKRS